MSEKMGVAQGPARKLGESSEQFDNPPLWSPWNFEIKHRDWHEIIYDEMSSSLKNGKNLEP